MQKTRDNRRNPFVALCEVASKNRWCWKLFCTTCGHGAFRVSFSRIIRGQHPDDESFWPNGKENASPLKEWAEYDDFRGPASSESQIALARIVAGAALSDIQAVARFPDWLGYIGLILRHCSEFGAQQIVSGALLPQFTGLVAKNNEAKTYFQAKQKDGRQLEISDLSLVESTMLGHD